MNTQLRDDDALFTALLERWASGVFTRADEATLQRLIGDDAFRREAWEGFTTLPAEEHAAALERLRRRLAPASARRRIGLMRYWAVAAAIFLLAGALYWWWADTPGSPEQAIAPASEWSAEDSQGIAAHSAPEEVRDENARRRAPTATEGAPHAQTTLQVPVPLPEKSALAHGEAASSPDTFAELAYPQDNQDPEMPSLAATRAAEQAAKTPPTTQEAMRTQETGRPAEPAATPPPVATKSSKPIKAHKKMPPPQPPSAVYDRWGERQPLFHEPLQPEGGWPAFLQQYRQTQPLERTVRADTLHLEVLVRSDGTLRLLSVEPALSRQETRRLEDFLRQYRWTPATNTKSTLRLPVEH